MCAKKMFLVDPLKFNGTEQTPRPVRDGLATSISTLDQEMQDILSNDSIDDRTKAQAYQQILQRYIFQSEKYQRKPLGRVEITGEKTVTNENDNLSKEETSSNKTKNPGTLNSNFDIKVLRSVPKHLKEKASLLLEYLKADPNISWDQKDQLIVNSQTVNGSNGVDLINDLLRMRKTVKPPHGWDTLAATLKQSNIPKEVIGNSDRWSWIERARKEPRLTPHRKSNKSSPKTRRNTIPSSHRLRWETFN